MTLQKTTPGGPMTLQTDNEARLRCAPVLPCPVAAGSRPHPRAHHRRWVQESEGAGGSVLGCAVRNRRGSGWELGWYHECDRRVEAAPAATRAARRVMRRLVALNRAIAVAQHD